MVACCGDRAAEAFSPVLSPLDLNYPLDQLEKRQGLTCPKSVLPASSSCPCGAIKWGAVQHDVIIEIVKAAGPWIARCAYREISPLFDNEQLPPIAELNRRHYRGSLVNRQQPDPNAGQCRAGDAPPPPLSYPE